MTGNQSTRNQVVQCGVAVMTIHVNVRKDGPEDGLSKACLHENML